MIKSEVQVENMVKKFQEKGLDIVYAKCQGYNTPKDISGVEPDVVGWDPSKEMYHLGLITDSSNISSMSTDKKMNVLAKLMMSRGTSEGERLPFYLGFPKNSAKDVDEKLQKIEPSTLENIEKLAI